MILHCMMHRLVTILPDVSRIAPANFCFVDCAGSPRYGTFVFLFSFLAVMIEPPYSLGIKIYVMRTKYLIGKTIRYNLE